METKVGKCLCGEPEKVIEENGKQILCRCPLYIKLIGKNPQTGEPVDEWNCAIAWVPILLIENSQHSRHVGAAVESMRNEMVKSGDAISGAINRALVLKDTRPRQVLEYIGVEDID